MRQENRSEICQDHRQENSYAIGDNGGRSSKRRPHTRIDHHAVVMVVGDTTETVTTYVNVTDGVVESGGEPHVVAVGPDLCLDGAYSGRRR